MMHRFILNAPHGMFVDHIDGNTLNNTRSNLRICTRTENNRHVWKRKDNTIGFKGVKIASPHRWSARIKVNGKRIHLGSFKSPLEAAKAYDEAAKKYHGEFAVTNF